MKSSLRLEKYSRFAIFMVAFLCGQEIKSSAQQPLSLDKKSNETSRFGSVNQIEDLLRTADSAEIIRLLPGQLKFYRFLFPEKVANITEFECLSGYPVASIKIVSANGKRSLQDALTRQVEPKNAGFTFAPSFAIRCFTDNNFTSILISPHDHQAKILLSSESNIVVNIPNAFVQSIINLAKASDSDTSYEDEAKKAGIPAFNATLVKPLDK